MKQQANLGKLIDQLDAQREQYREASAVAAKIKDKYDELKEVIQARLADDQIDKATGSRATVSLKHSLVASIDDYDALTSYIKKTGHFQLFNRAINAESFREIYALEMGKLKQNEERFIKVTGLKPYTKVTLNHATLKAA